MNNRMYEHAATQSNLRTLRERGVLVLEPGSGRLASQGEEGIGRLAEPVEMLAACDALLAGAGQRERGRRAPAPLATASPAGTLEGCRVLITAGGTREPIDSVRFIGNSSSGRMGLALAKAARDRGADVRLLAANIALPRPAGIAYRDVVSAARARRGLRGGVSAL